MMRRRLLLLWLVTPLLLESLPVACGGGESFLSRIPRLLKKPSAIQTNQPFLRPQQERDDNATAVEAAVAITTNDTIEKFSKDVEHVIHVLKASEYGSDPTIPDVYRNPIYDNEEWWYRHISRWRYVRYMIDFPFNSKLLKRTLPQLFVVFCWSCLAVGMSHKDIFVARLHIGLTTLSLVSAFVASLLTLRGNQGLNRLRDARQVIGQVGLHTREMAQLIGTEIYDYSNSDNGNDSNDTQQQQQLALLAARHVTIFCWSLKAHLQGNNRDSLEVIQTMLPNPKDSYYITNYQRKPPVAILLRLRQIFSFLSASGKLDANVQKELFKTCYRLNEALMVAERVRISPIPSLYTTHTTRLLIFYLFWLPLALYGALGGNGIATLVVTVAVAYAMLGLDEISHILELPFRFMPLRQLSKVSMIEAADALVYRPPSLDINNNNNNCSRTSIGTPQTTSAPATTATTISSLPDQNNNTNPRYWYREQQQRKTRPQLHD